METRLQLHCFVASKEGSFTIVVLEKTLKAVGMGFLTMGIYINFNRIT